MTEHYLKTWPPQFQAVLDRTKTFEFRRADRPFAVGDLLRLQEYQPEDRVMEDGHVVVRALGFFTGRQTLVRVLYLMDKGFGLPDGFVIMGLDFMRPTPPTYVGNTGHGIPAEQFHDSIPTHTYKIGEDARGLNAPDNPRPMTVT